MWIIFCLFLLCRKWLVLHLEERFLKKKHFHITGHKHSRAAHKLHCYTVEYFIVGGFFFGDVMMCFCLPAGRQSYSQPGHQAGQQGDWSQGKFVGKTLNVWPSLQRICLHVSHLTSDVFTSEECLSAEMRKAVRSDIWGHACLSWLFQVFKYLNLQ